MYCLVIKMIFFVFCWERVGGMCEKQKPIFLKLGFAHGFENPSQACSAHNLNCGRLDAVLKICAYPDTVALCQQGVGGKNENINKGRTEEQEWDTGESKRSPDEMWDGMTLWL